MALPAKLLLQILDEAYQKRTWHGPNLKQSLRGVTLHEAVWRPASRRHNIWELAVHAAYWKYAVRRRLRGDARGSFPVKGSNWFSRPAASSAPRWRQDRALLEQEHIKLRDAVIQALRRPQREPTLRLIFGVAFHDVYHAGQVRLLRRLYRQKKREARK